MPVFDWSWASTSNLALCPGQFSCNPQSIINGGSELGQQKQVFAKAARGSCIHFLLGEIELCQPQPRRDSAVAFMCPDKMKHFLGIILCLEIKLPIFSIVNCEHVFLTAWKIVQLWARSASEAQHSTRSDHGSHHPFFLPPPPPSFSMSGKM